MESNGLGAFDHYDDNLNYFNMLNKSIEKMPQTISREFMERSNNDQPEHRPSTNIFRSFTPFASGEFGKH